MNILTTIVEQKREDVARAKRVITRSELLASDGAHRSGISLIDALKKTGMNIVAEIKKASPSKGIIRPDFDPVAVAMSYTEHGAAALSVLTEEHYFQGSLDVFRAVRAETALPMLRKDFIIDSYQIAESKSVGADALLLIVAALDPAQLREFHAEALEMGLDVLVEVHNERELDTLDLDRIALIGVNNRDLTTFQVDVGTTLRLRKLIPASIPMVSESGLSTSADLKRLREQNVFAALIGETFMRAADPGKALQELLQEMEGSLPCS